MRKVSVYIKIIVGIVLIISAYSKIISPGIVEIILVDHGISATRESAALIVRLLIALEFSLGLLLLFPYYQRKIIIPFGIIFLSGFTFYLIYAGFILADSQNCGCFGSLISMSPVESIIKNIVLIILLMIAFKFSEKDKKNITATIIIIVLSFAGTFIFSPINVITDSKFAGYTDFIGEGRVDLNQGDKLIAILNTECDHCRDLAKDLSIHKRNTKKFNQLYALVFSEGNISIDSFKAETGFDFPYHMISVGEFFDLIGSSPPRIYWLNNGTVKETWDNNFVENIKEHFKE